MKNFLLKSSLLCILAAAFLGCNPDNGLGGKGNFNLQLKTVEAGLVEIAVTAPKDSLEMAYVLSKESQVYSAAVLFRQGNNVAVNPGDVLTIDRVIEPAQDYFFYAVAKLDEGYSNIIKLEFTTPSYEFDKLLTLVDTYYDGYKLQITVPEEVKERGNAIRYSGGTSMAFYNVLKSRSGDEAFTILQGTVFTGNLFGNYAKNDTTLLRDNSNIVVLDENDEPVLDEYGQQIDIHEPISPGEPVIVWAGECAWGTDAEMGAIMGSYTNFKGESYVVPLFDWSKSDENFDWEAADATGNYEGSGWTGAFQRLIFKTKEPVLCDVDFNIEIDKVTVTDALVTFNMGDDVRRYFYMILDDATYNNVVDIYLDGDEDGLQWFLTSYLAFYEWGIGAMEESATVQAAASFNDGALIGGSTYHVLCTVMADEEGGQQKFFHETFKAAEKTKDAPVITVTPVYEGVTDDKGNLVNTSYTATFNIKAPNKDVEGAYWACNYAREFELMFNADYTYETILKGNYTLSKEELQLLNSDGGLTLSFPTLDGEEMRFAIYGCNDEFTFNVMDRTVEGYGWADYEAPMLPPANKIQSPYYESLVGDWTATATIKVNQKLDDGSVASRNVTHESKITISNSAPYIPETLTQDIYDLYAKGGEGKNKVDEMFGELKDLSDKFTESRLVGQNRLLVSGFIDFDYYTPSRMNLMTPYDLFTSPNYSSVDVPQIMYDFGPKWYLEVQADGTLIAPFNSATLPPMHSWPGYPFWLGGFGTDSKGNSVAFYDPNDDVKGFPVEVSADNNTITIKPIVLGGENGAEEVSYYMNALGANGSTTEVEIVATVLSDIVLTRGWDGDSGEDTTPSVTPSKARAVKMNGEPVSEMPKVRIYKSLTKFENAPKAKYKVDDTPNVVTMEMVNTTADKILKHFNVK